MAAPTVESGVTVSRFLADEAAQQRLGAELAQRLHGGALIFLHGDLGAGKTTLARGLIRQLGHAGNVKSPTYSLIEPYRLADVALYHIDLYRVGDPGELEFLGIRELLDGDHVLLIEWPERAEGSLPTPDLTVTLRTEEAGRRAELVSHTPLGASLLEGLSQQSP